MCSKRNTGTIDQLDLFPPTTHWQHPTELPDWTNRPLIAIDTETNDQGLSTGKGAGWALPDMGYIVGVSMAVSASDKIYVPIRHPQSSNWPVDQVIRWVEAHIKSPAKKVFHHSVFDLGWLETDFGIEVRDMQNMHDTMALAYMLDENRYSYGLDNLCKDNALPAKDERKLREASAAFGIDPKKDLWKLQAKYVGEYAEQDAVSTLLLFQHLWPIIEQQNLEKAYQLEIDLIPLVNLMRRRGIRISEEGVDRALRVFKDQLDTRLASIKNILGLRRDVTPENIHSPKWLEFAFDEQRIPYPRTPKTHQGQFRSEWMETHEHTFPRLIAEARAYYDASEKFIKQYIQEYTFNGRIFSEIHHIRSDEGGTRSYRFSYSNPPLQQISADDQFGPLIRGCFLPEERELWGAFDLKGQEPALTVHTAAQYQCIGSAEAVSYYHTDPNPDYHTYVANLTGIPRSPAKKINLGITYGMQLPALSRRLGVSLEEAERIMQQYNGKMPFISQLIKIMAYEAETKGYITLIDGARCRFDSWEPITHSHPTQAPAPSLELAQKRWPGQRLRRFGTHKALNRRIQGSAARQIKMIMLECYKQGFYPLLQVHDELDFSLKDERVAMKIERIMCDTVPLLVPTRTDLAVGENWGAAK